MIYDDQKTHAGVSIVDVFHLLTRVNTKCHLQGFLQCLVDGNPLPNGSQA